MWKFTLLCRCQWINANKVWIAQTCKLSFSSGSSFEVTAKAVTVRWWDKEWGMSIPAVKQEHWILLTYFLDPLGTWGQRDEDPKKVYTLLTEWNIFFFLKWYENTIYSAIVQCFVGWSVYTRHFLRRTCFVLCLGGGGWWRWWGVVPFFFSVQRHAGLQRLARVFRDTRWSKVGHRKSISKNVVQLSKTI